MDVSSVVELLASHRPPWYIGIMGERAEADAWSWRLQQKCFVARVARGKKMAHRLGLFDEISAALQFPSYFGQNWDAFHECISDLAWLPPDPVVLIVTDALGMLDAEPVDALRILVEVLEDAAERQTEPVQFGSAFRFARQPLHIAFQATTVEMPLLQTRLALVGAELEALDNAAWRPGSIISDTFESK
jgi:RNAse (barnase) inhibitor barstar